MVVGSLSELKKYVEPELADLIFSFVDKVNNEDLKIGEWIALNNEIKGLLLTTSSFTEGVFESHRVYKDIHIVLKGSDTLFFGDIDPVVKAVYDTKGDYELFYSRPVNVVTLNKNMFALIEQGEIHSNQLTGNGSLKVVIKIK